MSGRKYPAIDLLPLYATGGTVKWNAYLQKCMDTLDLAGLGRTLYGIQAGMDDLAKKQLNTPRACAWYARLHKSLELTAQKIIRVKYPNPLDNPNAAPRFATALDAKRARDQALAKFLKEASY